jgi:hypothetical protein
MARPCSVLLVSELELCAFAEMAYVHLTYDTVRGNVLAVARREQKNFQVKFSFQLIQD